jgi:hypothetical protein
MPDWIKKRVLITVRTYPVPSAKSIEASCTAGIADDGQWIRLFPVPYRLMDQDRRFNKWQWIDVSVLKAHDGRPESHKINPDSIVIGDRLDTKDGWRVRRGIIEPLRRLSLCRIKRERDENGSPTLGVFRPFQIKRLLIDEADENWTPEQLATLKQNTLFQKAPEHTLEKIPFDFRYEFRCGDSECTGHTMLCTDWEIGQAYRRWRVEYGSRWERPFRNRFEKEIIDKFDTHFFVGTVHQYPSSWIIVGLFYPPKQSLNAETPH